MDRSEPALVPEWLKGASGGGVSGTTTHHHPLSALQSARHRPLQSQLSGASHGDYDSCWYSALTDRTSISSSRRGPSNNGSDRVNYDRDALVHPRAYTSFSRNSSFRGYDTFERDREVQRVEKERNREREVDFRDRDSSFGGDYRDRDQERTDNHQWSTSCLASRYETDATLRRSQSMMLNRRVENGIKKTGSELGSIAAPLIGGSLVSTMQKAAFERNFPSLGAEDRQGGIQSSLTSVSLVSTSSPTIWQGQGMVGMPDVGRASSPGLTIATGSSQGTSVSGADGWSSALADAPVPNGGSNGLVTSVQQIVVGSSVSSIMPGPGSTSGLNMAEALVQNPARVRTPPQLSVETQRLEELALKQSRQLIPMTPSMPKTMGLGPSEKLKPKALRTTDTTTSAVKIGQTVGSSQVLNSPFRASARPETPKLPQGGKLLVLKSAREKNGVAMAIKSDSLSPTKGGNIGNTSLGAFPASISGLGGNAGLLGSRKPKFLLDRKAVPISSIAVSSGLDCGTGARLKDCSLMIEEKKPLTQAQNRSDFFNALRRKASGSPPVTAIPEKSSISTGQKAVEQNKKGDVNVEGRADLKENGPIESRVENSDNAISSAEVECDLQNNATSDNAETLGEILTVKDTIDTGGPTASTNRVSIMGGSEEEEAAFLRSLGWEENAGGDEALTEEEINAFYQEHMEAMPAVAAFRRGSNKVTNLAAEMHVGSLGNMSSGLSSSDSETDDEVYARR